jgi:hypothetical protein
MIGDEAMQPNDIPIRTEAGEREIGTREHKLSWQTRALLVSIHGHKTATELGKLFKTPELLNAGMAELIGLGLVEIPAAVVAMPEPDQGQGITPLQQARQLLNDTAVGALGLLGGISAFRFTLKLERCYSPAELRAIFPDYRRLVAKSKGEEFAQAVIARVEALLAGS